MNRLKTIMYHVFLTSRILVVTFLLVKIYTAIFGKVPLASIMDVDLWVLLLLIDWYIRRLMEEVQEQN